MANKTFVGSTGLSWAVAAAWDPTGVPTTGDNVEIPASATYRILNGLDQSGVKLGTVRFTGYAQTVGNTTAATPSYLQLKCTRLECSLGNTAYISVESTSSTPISVSRTAAGTSGTPGFIFKNTTASPMSITGGSVGVASRQADTATLSVLRISGGTCIAGARATVTTARVDGGVLLLQTTGSTIDLYGGRVTTALTGVHTVKSYGGQAVLMAAANATLHMEGGNVASTIDPTTKNLTIKTANEGSIVFDPSVVTLKTTGGTSYTATTKRPARITFG